MNQLHENNYISTREASALTGYNSDYLARMCREEKIVGKQVGRTWILSQESLEDFVKKQDDRRQEIRESLSESREKEYQQARNASATNDGPAVKDLVFATETLEIASPIQSNNFRKRATALLLTLALLFSGIFVAQAKVISTLATSALSGAFHTHDGLHDIAVATINLARVDSAKEFALSASATRNGFPISSLVASSSDATTTANESYVAESLVQPFSALAIRVTPKVDAATFDTSNEISNRTSHSVATSLHTQTYPTIPMDTIVSSIGFAITHPLTATNGALRTSVAAYSSLIDGELHSYLQGIQSTGNASLALGTSVRDIGIILPYKFAGTIVALAQSTYDLGDAISTRTLYAPRQIVAGYEKTSSDVGELAYDTITGTTGAAKNTTKNIALRAGLTSKDIPGASEDALLGTVSNSSLALSNATQRVAGVAATASQTLTAPVVHSTNQAAAVVLPASLNDVGEQVALLTYETLHGLVNQANISLASIFGSDSHLAVVPTTLAISAPVDGKSTYEIPTYDTGDTFYSGNSTATTTVVRNIYTNPTYIVTPLVSGSGVSQQYVDDAISGLHNELLDQIEAAQGSGGGSSSGGSSGGSSISSNGAALTNGTIDNFAITNSNISGGPISATSLAVTGSTTLNTLTAATSTFTGGVNVNGDLTVGGVLTANTLNVTNLSSNAAVVAPYFTATSTSATSTFGGGVSVGGGLMVAGQSNFGNITFANATGTNENLSTLTTGTANVGSLSIGNLNGFLKATAGAISTSLINLATDVTGILPIDNGGTGTSSFATNGVVYGNGTTNLLSTGQGGADSVLVANGGAPSFSSAITVGTSVTTPIVNATTAYELNGVDINSPGALSDVAYLDQPNTFTQLQDFGGGFSATTGSFGSATATTITANTLVATTSSFVNTTATNATTTNFSTTNLGIGGNYFSSLTGTGLTNASGTLTVTLAPFTSDNLAEGTTNQYYTNARARGALSGGTGIGYNPTTGVISNTGVLSYNGRTGAVVPATGDYTTSQVTEGSNLYFTNARAEAALSGGTGISYNGTTGVITNSGVTSLTGTTNQINVSASTGAITLSLPSQVAFNSASTTNFSATTLAVGGTATTTIDANGALTTPSLKIGGLNGLLYGNNGSVAAATITSPLTFSAGVLGIQQANGTQDGFLSAADFNTFNNKISSSSLSGGLGIDYDPSTGIITNTGVISFNGRDGAVIPTTGDYTTDQVTEGSNLYYTDARAQAAISVDGTTPLTYNGGVIGLAQATTGQDGYLSANDFNTFNNKISSTSLSATAPLTYDPSSGVIGLGTVGQQNGGTGFTTYNPGDILYADNTGMLQTLPIGGSGQVLQVTSGLPSWGAVSVSSLSGGDGIFATSTSGAIYPLNPSTPLVIGSSATSTNNSVFEVHGQEYISSKLGIGTSTPSQALSVGGNALISGSLSANDLYDYNIAANSLVYVNGAKQEAGATITGPLTFTGGTLAITQATTTQAGYLSAADYTSFANKQAAIIAGTGLSFAGNTLNSFWTLNGSNNLYNNNTGTKVGINNANPTATLDVGGFINTDQYSGYQQGGALLAYASSTNLDTIFGFKAGGQTATTSATVRNLTAMGNQALSANTTGINNVAIGNNALLKNTSGSGSTAIGVNALAANLLHNNTAVGYNALAANTVAASSTAVGWGALMNNTGTSNTAIGDSALLNNSSGVSNTAVGASALINNSGNYNTAVGSNALLSNTSGYFNTAMGYTSQSQNTIGYGNSSFGKGSLQNNSTGNSNTAVGTQALQANTIGNYNTALGLNALTANSTGNNDIALGYSALANSITDNNVAVGNLALSTDSLGNGNTVLGNNSGFGLNYGSNNLLLGFSTSSASEFQVTTGSQNISIGYDVAIPSAIGSNQLDIGNLIYGTGIDGTGHTVSTGNIGIATTTPGSLLSIGNTNGINFSTATSTFSSTGGINLNGGGCFAINGNCINGSGITSISQTYGAPQTGAITFATSTTSFNGLTIGNNITNSGGVFTLSPTLSGDLTVSGGGTGVTSISGLLRGNGTSPFTAAVAGTDYLAPTSLSAGTGITYNSSTGVIANAGVLSFNGRTGVVSPATGDYTSDQVTEGNSNLYFTNARAQAAISVSGAPLTYTSGVIGITQASSFNSGYLSSTDYNTFNNKQNALTFGNLTTGPGLSVTGGTGAVIGSGAVVSLGTVPVANGGTGSTTLTGILLGNGTGGVLTAVAGTDYQAPITAGTGLVFSGNTLNAFWTLNGSNNLYNNNVGTKVGINNNAPTATLDVGGFINTDRYSGYQQNGQLLAYASSTNLDTIFGFRAGGQNATTTALGGYLTAVGYQALSANTTGLQNTAVGYQTLSANTTGSQNTALGMFSLDANVTGSNNLSLGFDSLAVNTTGSYNTSVGNNALFYNVQGGGNVAVGFNALHSQASYSVASSTAVGYDSLQSVTTGKNNTALGISTLSVDTTGNENIAIGNFAGFLLSSGSNNILLGVSSSTASYNQVTTGSNNISIGYNIAVPSSTGSNQLDIGNLIYGTGLNGSGTSVSTGNIGIGTTTPGSLLSIGNTNGINFSIATSTFSSTGGINLAAGCFAINGVCVGSSGVTSISQTYGTPQTGAITFATSTATFNGITAGDSVTNSGNTFTITPSWSGSLTVSGGGTGVTSISGLLKGNGTSPFTAAVAGTDYLAPTSLSGTAPITYNSSTGAIGITQSSSFNDGYLSSTDFNTFNNKQNALTFGNLTTGAGLTVTGGTGAVIGSGAVVSLGTVPVANGGTGSTTLTGLLKGNGTGSVLSAVAGTDYQAPITAGTGLVFSGNTLNSYFTLNGSNNIYNNNSGTKVGINNNAPTATLDVGGFINTNKYSGYQQNGQLLAYASSTNDATIFGFGAGGQAATTSPLVTLMTAVGLGALSANTTSGTYNSAFGTQALYHNTNGASNTSLGAQSMFANTTGSNNIALGAQSLFANTTGSYNTALGTYALTNNTSGSTNTAIGRNALGTSNTASGNTALGNYAGYGISFGSNNIVLGAASSSASINQIVYGSNNISIGYDIAVPSQYASGQLDIGNLLYGTGLDGSGTTVSTGSIGIGTTTPGSLLSIGNTNGINFSTATSTFSSTGGINLYGGCFAINGTCINGSGITSISQTYGAPQTGAITFATSTATFNGITAGDTITNSGGTFTVTPSWSGSLTVSGGGTGVTSISGLLKGNGTSPFTAAVAGTDYLAPTSLSGTAPITYNSSTGAIGITQSGSFSDGYLSSTDYNTFNNKQNALTFGNLTVGSGLSVTGGTGAVIGSGAVVSLGIVPVANGGTGLATPPTYGQILVGNASGGYTLTATSSLGYIQNIGPAGQTQSGPTVVFASTTSTTNGLTSAITITGSGNTITYTPSTSGTLAVSGGGSGATSLTGLLKGNGTSPFTAAVAGTDYLAPTSLSGGTGITYNSSTGVIANAGVLSFNGRTGVVSPATGDYTSDQVTEGNSNLYFTNARAQAAISVSGAPLTYTSGVIGITQASSFNSGYLSSTDYNTFNNKQNALTFGNLTTGTGLSVTGGTGAVIGSGAVVSLGTVPVANGGTGSTTLTGLLKGNGTGAVQTAVAGTDYLLPTSLSGIAPITYNSSTGAIGITQAGSFTDGYLSSTDYNNFNNKQNALTLTTTGTSGAATLTGSVLNIPNYAGGVTSVSNSDGTLTINPTTGAVVASINLANPNTFTALQQFNGNASSTQFTTLGNTYLAAAGGSVDIGTTTSGAALMIDSASTGSTAIRISNGSVGAHVYSLVDAGSSNSLGPVGRFGIYDYTAGAERLTIDPTGNVGIGTTTPAHLLTLNTSDTNTNLTTSALAEIAIINNNNATANNYSAVAFDTTDTNGASVTGAKITGIFDSHTPGAVSGDLAFVTKYLGSNGERMRLTAAGNLGVGTTTPGSLLSIGNTNGINFSTATSTFSSTGGINLASGCYAINGNCIGSGVTSVTNSDGTLTITPTTGAVVANLNLANANTWTGTQTFNAAPYSALFTGGNVGIGTSTPVRALDIAGNGELKSQILIEDNNAAVTANNHYYGIQVANGVFNINAVNDNYSTSTAFTINQNNNVGIGSSTPGASLGVQSPLGQSALTPIFEVGSTTAAATANIFSIGPSGYGGVNAAAGGGVIQFNNVLNCVSAGSTCSINQNGQARLTVTSAGDAFAGTGDLGNSSTHFAFNAPTDTGIIASTNAYIEQFNNAVTRTHSSGAITEEDQFIINPATETFATGVPAASVISTTSAMTIQGISGVGARGSFGNNFSLLVNSGSSGTVTASSTNNYGLGIYAPTGGTNNYAAEFLGGAVGIGTTTPYGLLAIDGTSLPASTAPILTIKAGTGTGDIFDIDSNAGGKALYMTQFGVLNGGNMSFAEGTFTNNSPSYAALTVQATFGGGTADILQIGQNGRGVYSEFNSRGELGIGTTSTPWELDVATSSTNAFFNNGQLAISDTNAGANLKHILFSNENGNLFIGPATDLYATSTPILSLLNGGNVGIGTTTPKSTLSITGSLCISQGTGATVACGTTPGNAYGTAFNTGAYDVAENYRTTDFSATQPGTIVSLDTVTGGETIRTASTGSTILGVVSTNPGLKLGGADASTLDIMKAPVALSGRIPVRVDMEGGPIGIGDRIALSSTPGVGMKATQSGETVGIALQGASASGSIDVFVQPQYYFSSAGLSTATVASSMIVGSSTDAASSTALTVNGNSTTTGTVNASAYSVTGGGTAFMNQFSGLALGSTTPSSVLTANGQDIDLYKMATYTLSGVQALANQITAISSTTATLGTQINSLSARVSALEAAAVAATSNPATSTDQTATSSILSTTTAAVEDAMHGLGALIQNGIAQFDTLVVHNLVFSKDTDGASAAGSGTILQGNTVAEIDNPNMTSSSEVSITFTAPVQGSWYVSDKEDGKFKITLSAAQTSDVTFDYFIVQTQGQIATSTSATASTGGFAGWLSHLFGGSTPATPVTPPTPATPPVVSPIGTSTPDTASSTDSTASSTDTTASSTGSVSGGASSQSPTIGLLGSAAISLTQGDIFTDPGASAHDASGKDISSSITESGSVDTATPGIYTLKYSVSDSSGQSSSVSRVVTVSAAYVPTSPSPTPTPPTPPATTTSAPAPTPTPASTPVDSSTPGT